MAVAGASKWKNEPNSVKKNPDADLTSRDEDLLDEPFARAVLEMDYPRQDVLRAIRSLQKRPGDCLTAKALLQEVMNMESSISTPGASPRGGRKRSAPAAANHYGSDGESDSDGGSMEVADVSSSFQESEGLQTDGEATRDCNKMAKMGGKKAPPVKKSRKDLEDFRVKLMALREENRRLKARQMCRKCGARPVSITFLPCGHFSFCFECGQGFQSCPICRKPILADVRTFLA